MTQIADFELVERVDGGSEWRHRGNGLTVLMWPTPDRMRMLRALRAGKPRSMNAAKLPEGVGVYKRGFVCGRQSSVVSRR